MPKIDGMDPKLVRDLLAELRGAAKQMEAIEARVTTTVRNAGVPAAVTYRPSAVADAIAEMDKDVTARLALLEKRERDPNARPTPTGNEPPKPSGGTEPPKPTTGDTDPPKPTSGGSEPSKPTSGDTDPPKQTSGDSDPPKKSTEETAPPKKSDEESTPPKKSDEEGAAPKKADDESAPPKKSDEESTPPKKSDEEGAAPKKADDESAPPKKSDEESTPPKKSEGESPAPQKEPIDTPKKDHPDDIDQTRGRVEINVDGTKVVTYPLNLPDDLRLDNDLDTVRPVDMPGQSAGTPSSSGPQPDGKPGYVEPLEPTVKQPAPQPGLDPGDPMGAYVGTPADNLTEDPFLKNNPASQPAPQPGLAPGDPMGAYVGTPADNVTEDPYLKGNPVSQPAPQPGLAPGDPMGAYVGTPADNVTEDPYLKHNPVTQPAPQPGLAPGDPMGAYVGTPADNVTEDPFLQGTPAGTSGDAPGNPTNTLPEDTVLITASDSAVAPQIQAEVPTAAGEAVDPRALAAAQPGDVLSAPANQISDQALGTLLNHDDQIAPQNMPTVTDTGVGAPQGADGNPTATSGNPSAADGTQPSGHAHPGGTSESGANSQTGGHSQPGGSSEVGANSHAGGNAQAGGHSQPGGTSESGANSHAGGNAQAGGHSQPGGTSESGVNSQAGSNPQSGGDSGYRQTGNAGIPNGPLTGSEGNPGNSQGGNDGQCGPQGGDKPAANGANAGHHGLSAGSATGQSGLVTGPTMAHYGPAGMSADGQAGSGFANYTGDGGQGGSAGQAGADIDPRRLAAEQPGDVLSAPANQISDQALGALLNFDDRIAPQDMPSMTTGGAGSEGGAGHGPSGSGSDQSASASQSGSAGQEGTEVDPRKLAAEQPGDVLSAQVSPISDQALGALLNFDDRIAPQDMPSMTTGGSGSEGGPGQGPSPSGSDQSSGGRSGADVDPRRLAAEQPGDVLSVPADPASDEAIAALIKNHAQIEPMDMPSVSVPEGKWGTGEWVPMDVGPDGPSGSVPPGQPA
ncbi:hypothetical protein [Herbidospora cretacea]|uniref:hypothetical protein n=1 Tax=Herbidospora cretacea TaxID=28444 RepID=UPI000773B470|nr:hypothetical protein [Herbidospora cretacea]